MKILSASTAEKIKNRKPIKRADDPWLLAYTTRGGTYIIASNGEQNDRPGARDLIMVRWDGWITSLAPNVSPTLVEEVEEAVNGK